MLTGTAGTSFSRQGSWYLVETRARVIIFDIAAFEADSALQRRSSWLPPAPDHPHKSGLMSWPENFFKPRQHKQNSEGNDQPANSLSARAMQLSIYGSMVCLILSVSLVFGGSFVEEKLCHDMKLSGLDCTVYSPSGSSVSLYSFSFGYLIS